MTMRHYGHFKTIDYKEIKQYIYTNDNYLAEDVLLQNSLYLYDIAILSYKHSRLLLHRIRFKTLLSPDVKVSIII